MAAVAVPPVYKYQILFICPPSLHLFSSLASSLSPLVSLVSSYITRALAKHILPEQERMRIWHRVKCTLKEFEEF